MQSAEFENGQPVKLRIPDKIAAVKELTKMCGWAQPNRIELSARDTLAEFIDSIRQAPRRPGMAAYAEDNGVRRHRSAAHRPRSRQNLLLSGGTGPFKPPSSAWVFRNAS